MSMRRNWGTRTAEHRGMEITVVDVRALPGWNVGKYAGPLTSMVNRSAVRMRYASTMVHGVIVRPGRAKMTCFNVIEHGSESGLELGDELVIAERFGQHARQLSQLESQFYRP
jgi:hypothetical protein